MGGHEGVINCTRITPSEQENCKLAQHRKRMDKRVDRVCVLGFPLRASHQCNLFLDPGAMYSASVAMIHSVRIVRANASRYCRFVHVTGPIHSQLPINDHTDEFGGLESSRSACLVCIDSWNDIPPANKANTEQETSKD